MKMHQVKSSNIKAIGHSGNIMHGEYSNGGKYSFSGVDKESYNKLMESDTKGSYLHKMGLKGTKIEEVKQ